MTAMGQSRRAGSDSSS